MMISGKEYHDLLILEKKGGISNHRNIPIEPVTGIRHYVLMRSIVELEGVKRELAKEEAAERDEGRRYWSPLRKELERLRHSNRGK